MGVYQCICLGMVQVGAAPVGVLIKLLKVCCCSGCELDVVFSKPVSLSGRLALGSG